jgi:hypothetical protein
MVKETGTVTEVECEFTNVLQETIRSTFLYKTRGHPARPKYFAATGSLCVYRGFPCRSQ